MRLNVANDGNEEALRSIYSDANVVYRLVCQLGFLRIGFGVEMSGMVLSARSGSTVVGDGAAGTESDFVEAYFCTSSFRTRPSLPVPGMSSMLRLSSFVKWRTAGVARVACLCVPDLLVSPSFQS